MLTPPPAHLSLAGLDRMFSVHRGSTLSLTGATLQNGKVRLTDKHTRGGVCSGGSIQRIIQRCLFAAAFALRQWRCSFCLATSLHLLTPPLLPSPAAGWFLWRHLGRRPPGRHIVLVQEQCCCTWRAVCLCCDLICIASLLHLPYRKLIVVVQ
jgi:hypothetical protein